MFGLFENKQGKALVAETLRTIEHADLLSAKDKNKVAKNVFTKIIKAINEIDGVPLGPKLDKIMQKQIQDATKQRQKQITAKEEKNPKVGYICDTFLEQAVQDKGKKSFVTNFGGTSVGGAQN